MITKNIEIKSASGLHARPATLLANLAKKFNANVLIALNGKKVDAKSIIAILSLGVSNGSEISLIIDGQDENEAMEAICELIRVELTHA